MRVALVHELLTIRGGAERVLRVLANMYPDAPIFTFLYDEALLGDWFPRERIVPSRLQRWAALSTNHHFYLSRFPATVEAWNFSGFDLVLSSSSAFAHGIITNGKPAHLCYVHSPARYLWDRTHDVLGRAGRGLLGPLRRRHLERTFHPLRVWDAEAADRPDALLAASREVQRRIELYWRRDSDVVYPPLDDRWLTAAPKNVAMEHSHSFLIVSTLAAYKRLDLAVRACSDLGVHLKVVGTGPARAALERLAGPTVEFYGHREGDELVDLFGNATATIVPGEEDFGLVPLESLACGTPVIAYRAGGLLETMTPQTAAFFDAPTVESLMEALRTFDRTRFDPAHLRSHAQQFSRARFETQIQQHAERLLARVPR